MTATIQPYAFDGTWANPLMPISGGTVNSDPFTIPQRAKSICMFVPALVGASATVKIQGLKPVQDIENASESWSDLYVFDFTDGTTEALDGIPEGQATTLPTSALGSTVIRFVASEDQSSLPVRIPVFMNYGGG